MVVNPIGRERSRQSDGFTPKQRCRSGNQRPTKQRIEWCDGVRFAKLAIEADILPHGAMDRLQGVVGQVKIRKRPASGWIGFQRRDHALHFRGKPKIVLIRQENDIPGTGENRVLEIRVRAEVSRLDGDVRFQRGVVQQLMQQLGRAIGRNIVAHHDLVGETGLGENALDLLTEEGGSVPGAQGDRNLHGSIFGQLCAARWLCGTINEVLIHLDARCSVHAASGPTPPRIEGISLTAQGRPGIIASTIGRTERSGVPGASISRMEQR